ncbi:MAG: GMC family oxidoreductase N-terminal domain-containing protein [Actinomycetota bacterium]|nr:GMC family oxidoreductase N-terminal domain-containing protein [Actinomycetota bacterium]
MAVANARGGTEWAGEQLDALAESLLPPGGGMPTTTDAGTGRRAAQILAGLPPPLRRLVGMELRLLDRVSRTTLGAPFAELTPQRRRALLARVGRLPGLLSEAARPLELMAVLAYSGAPEVQAAIGAEPGSLVPLAGPLPPARRLPVRSHPDIRAGFSETFDAVVVGSGAGGAPVARELARAGWSVAVVEEGDAFSREDFTGSDLERMRRLYRDAASTTTVGRPPVLLPIGRAVGGTTVVNSGTCFRTPDHVVAGWGRVYGVDISPEDLVPFYEDVEDTLGVAPVPWEVMGNNGAIAHRGATALGIPGRPIDRNAEGCHGSGVCALGCPVDGKRGVHLNYLPQSVEAGAQIFARLRANRVVVRGGRAVGVEGVVLGEGGRPVGPFRLGARRVVVVAAGAPFTPGILRRSGLRGRTLGGNLRIHPATAVAGLFDEEVVPWRGVLQSYQVDALAGRGIMLESTFPPPGLAAAEVAMTLAPEDRLPVMVRLRHMAVLGLLVSDTSSGRAIDLGAARTPLLTYRVNANDARRTLDGLLLAARVLLAAGATEVWPMVAGAGRVRSMREAEALLGRNWPAAALRMSAYHPMGTARMGLDSGGVVDGFGRVRGVERLVVPDASVFPTSLAVNPQLTIMAFATRAARRILDAS